MNRDKRIVFDAPELPFFKVRPDLTDLGISPTLGRQLEEAYPNFMFLKPCVVDGAVLIQDTITSMPEFDFETAETMFNLTRDLNKTSGITLQVVDAALPNKFLLDALTKPAFVAMNPTVIFPGEGAKIVREYMDQQGEQIYDYYDMQNGIYLPTQRIMRKKGEFDMKVDYSALPPSLKSEYVIIVDDVIASGQTVQTIAEELRARYGGIKIIAMAWFMMKPTVKENQESESGIKGVDLTIAGFALKGNYVSRPPVNSLSCFIKDYGKYQQIKNAFMERYIDNPDLFNVILSELKYTP